MTSLDWYSWSRWVLRGVMFGMVACAAAVADIAVDAVLAAELNGWMEVNVSHLKGSCWEIVSMLLEMTHEKTA